MAAGAGLLRTQQQIGEHWQTESDADQVVRGREVCGVNSPIRKQPEGGECNPHEVPAGRTTRCDDKRRPRQEPQEHTPDRAPRGMREQERQILRPTFTKLSPVAVHARAHSVSAITEVYGLAGVAEQTGERYVLEDFRGHGGVSTYGVVGGAPDEDILPVRGNDSRLAARTLFPILSRILLARFVGRVLR